MTKIDFDNMHILDTTQLIGYEFTNEPTGLKGTISRLQLRTWTNWPRRWFVPYWLYKRNRKFFGKKNMMIIVELHATMEDEQLLITQVPLVHRNGVSPLIQQDILDSFELSPGPNGEVSPRLAAAMARSKKGE